MHQLQVRPFIPELIQPFIIRVIIITRLLSAGYIGHEALTGSVQFVLVFENLDQRMKQGLLLLLILVLQTLLSIYLFDTQILIGACFSFIWTGPIIGCQQTFSPWLRRRGSCNKNSPQNQTNNDLTLAEAPADGKHNHFQSPNFGSCVATLNSRVFFNLLDSK